MTQYESIYDEDDLLGGGSFGIVRKVRRKRDLKVFACKSIVYDEKLKNEKLAKREFEILAQLNNPNIVRYVDAQWEPRQAKIYMEFCKEQSLSQLIERHARVQATVHEDYIWSIVYQLSNALSYCHHGKRSSIDNTNEVGLKWTAPILHRDIKPGNVFLSSSSEIALDAVKLGDFGLGVILHHGMDPSTYVGTRKYMPPEISNANVGINRWTSKCDIFSLGCMFRVQIGRHRGELFTAAGTLYELCALSAPFEDHMESDQEQVAPISEIYSTELRLLISGCISFKPNDRPDASDILETAQTKMQDSTEYKAAFLNFQLLQAAGRGDLDCVLCLLKDGARIGAVAGTDGEGVLHRAAKSRNEALLQFLLDEGAELAHSAHNGETPLHCAAATGLCFPVRLLLNKGAHVGTVDKRGWNVLHTAAANNNSEILDMLLKEADTINYLEYRTLDQKRLTPLHIAARNDCEETVQCLINAGANIEATMNDGNTALHLAAASGYVLVLNILLEQGDKFGTKKQGKTISSALHMAVTYGHAAAAHTLLLKKKSSMESRDANGKTPLHSAALYGHESVIELLISMGADSQAKINKGDKRGWTALHLASEAGHEKAVTALLNLSLDVNAKTLDGETALHWATLRGHIPVAMALLKQHANVQAKGANQLTSLHWAAFSGQLEMLQILLDHGAELEATTYSGETALLLAALYGCDAVVRELIKRGTAIEACNFNKETALQLASKNGKEGVMRILIEKGARPTH